MSIKLYKPTTPARRGMTTADYSEITAKKPLKSLLGSKKQQAGRNNSGRVTVRHRGGGVKRHYRLLNHNLAADLKLTVEEIIKASLPFVGIQFLGLMIFTLFPQLALWLPGFMN